MKLFDQTTMVYQASDGERNSGITLSAVVDEFSRFKLWAGTIGVLHNAKLTTSLDHRLRKAHRVSSYIIKLLTEIATSLRDCK
jgi:hypothetical protein